MEKESKMDRNKTESAWSKDSQDNNDNLRLTELSSDNLYARELHKSTGSEFIYLKFMFVKLVIFSKYNLFHSS